ncbi:nitrite/sulfite reductase [Ponticaulis sp.]|uniref:nitrite/sulfite reductase n=1 Tax=Ponticaulis sp. TaxID=2020902 RepID=UPI000B6BBA10|nr:nitrite/sulfite reductase [Ponticaulis sp.]MAJ08920.1 sulfite reductase [Ponticaulis sp.]RPG16718.1 MAG: nitrite/sulfite reductase [Hyphomonadaceae bacterium TMED125]|tara:strand:+ start:9784 stop:11445 length:1662 start_codon:yes stop_codon:yes gene_type:complete
MYRYDEFDAQIVRERAAQFRGQVERRLSGDITEDQFKPLRLMNGVYLQLHAYMLRIAIPYGTLRGEQMRKFAHIARKYDKGYGHWTTRQNIQFNWVALKDIPDVLDELAEVEMHAIQTSGNCIRNTTSDQFAGATAEEIEDPRPWCEIIRQWSTFHPEFSFLPRKFKIAVTAAENDRAAIRVHDIGLHMRRNDAGETGFEVIVGGGQGRTPHVGVTIKPFVAKDQLLDYLEAIMRVYNRFGRRDNKYKARIKILVSETGAEEFTRLVDEEFEAQRDAEKIVLPQAEVDRITQYFAPPAFEDLPDTSDVLEAAKAKDEAFARWVRVNVRPHKQAGYGIVTISCKPIGAPPGDVTDTQMEVTADLAERYSLDEIRITHEQNMVLPHVKLDDLFDLYQELDSAGLATANYELISDIICCPGLDYCNLANARSIPVAQDLQNTFADLERQDDIGELKIKISGCINACGHHHVGHIGILGVDRKGEEFYQITFGGRADEKAAIGQIAGPGLRAEDVPSALERVIEAYREVRSSKDERFIDALERVGHDPFKEALYAAG